ncbi:MAG: protein kinase [bacterium]|nr:protein kinase [bacterium]
MSKEDLVGKIVGKYKIVEKIGEGGMGIVYKGIQISLNRPVAMKMLPQNLASDKDFVTRFKQEALSVAKLNHRNIIQVYDTEQLEGNYFIIMEYIEGETLDELLKRKKALPLDFTLEILQQVGMALSYAHKHGVVHRDVKPGNIMIAADGSIKVMDFGIAKVQDSSVKTKTGMSIGTPEYMSPEQVKGTGVDSKSDMYAFGVLSYRMLAGELPFKGKDPFATAYKHLHEDIPSPRAKNPKISLETEEMVLKCMKKDKNQRYQDMNDVIQLLKRLLRQPATADGKTVAIPGDAGVTVMAKDIVKKTKIPIKAIVPAVLLVVIIIGIYIAISTGKKDIPSPHVVEKSTIDKVKTAEKKVEETIAKDIESQKPVVTKEEEPEKKKVLEAEDSRLVEMRKKNEEKIKSSLTRGKIHFNLGAQNSGEYKLAIENFEAVLELSPDNIEAREYKRLAMEGIIRAEMQAKAKPKERVEEKEQKKQEKLAKVDKDKVIWPVGKKIPIGGLFRFDSVIGQNTQINFIQGITIDNSDNIYVIDTVGKQNSSVLKLSPKGDLLAAWQNKDIGRPMDIDIDKEGNVYICNMSTYSINKFSPEGTLVASIGKRGHGKGQLDQPRGVAVDKEGNVYVADTRHYRIQKFDKDGNYLTAWGKRGAGNSQFSYIWDVAADESGNVYALDYKLGNVQKFDSAGNFLLKFGRLGQRPQKIAINNGYMFVVSAANMIQVFDASGNYITKWGSRGGGDGQFNSPTGIAFDSKGYVYVTDTGNRRQLINSRIQKFRPPQ